MSKQGTIKVVIYKVMVCRETGAHASVFGSHPGPSYDMQERGYTWQVTDQQGNMRSGLCRPAAKTRSEANQVAATHAKARNLRIIREEAL